MGQIVADPDSTADPAEVLCLADLARVVTTSLSHTFARHQIVRKGIDRESATRQARDRLARLQAVLMALTDSSEPPTEDLLRDLESAWGDGAWLGDGMLRETLTARETSSALLPAAGRAGTRPPRPEPSGAGGGGAGDLVADHYRQRAGEEPSRLRLCRLGRQDSRAADVDPPRRTRSMSSWAPPGRRRSCIRPAGRARSPRTPRRGPSGPATLTPYGPPVLITASSPCTPALPPGSEQPMDFWHGVLESGAARTSTVRLTRKLPPATDVSGWDADVLRGIEHRTRAGRPEALAAEETPPSVRE